MARWRSTQSHIAPRSCYIQWLGDCEACTSQ
jgi:hypothetical protein